MKRTLAKRRDPNALDVKSRDVADGKAHAQKTGLLDARPEEDPVFELHGADGGQVPAENFPRFYLTAKKPRKGGKTGNQNFHKANALVHNQPQTVMTVTQQKLTNILLKHAQLNTPIEPEMWSMSVSDMLGQLNIETRNLEHLGKTIDAMMNIKVRWDVFEEYGLAKHYAVVFPYAKIYNGKVTFKIEREAIKLLQANQSYTNLDLREMSQLNKVCSVPLYELACRYLGIGASRWLTWEELRDMLVAAEKIPLSASKWATFNERYLSPALQDINTATALFVEMEVKKEGRKVTHVRLHAQRHQGALENTASRADKAQRNALMQKMQEIGVLDRAARRFMEQYSEEEIQGALSHTQWRLTASKLRSLLRPGLYFANSLKKKLYNEAPQAGGVGTTVELFPVIDGLAKKKNEPSNGVVANTSTKGREKLVKAVVKQRMLDVKVILGEMSKGDLLELHEEYNARITVAALRIKEGTNKAGVRAAFHDWYAKRLYGEVTDAEIVQTMARIYAEQPS